MLITVSLIDISIIIFFNIFLNYKQKTDFSLHLEQLNL